jgi:CRISPR-associated protein Cmr6
MKLPLYQGSGEPEYNRNISHAGLFFERLLPIKRDRETWKVASKETSKQEAFQKMEGSCGDPTQLQSYGLRRLQLVEAIGGVAQAFSTEYRFVTGMGNPHPLENGMAWHPTLGVPYLSGTAVKGVLRSWIETWEGDAGNDEERRALLEHWFGTESKSEVAEQAGHLVFHDAIPIKPPRLKMDIMTPHMDQWYAQGQRIKDPWDGSDVERVPGDWHEPNPIPFLVVDENASFLFAISPRRGASTEDAQRAMEMLSEALEWLGAGAKTATGYGRLLPDDKAISPLRARMEELNRKRDKAAELEEALGAVADWPEDARYLKKRQAEASWLNVQFLDEVESFLDDHEEPSTEAVEFLCEMIETFWKGILANPEATKGKKNKPVYGSERARKLAHRLNQLAGKDS